MNQPRDPNVTTDLPPAPAASLPVADALATTDHAPDAAAPRGELPAVPGYRVLREIARGGMGRVLAAHDLTLDRDVALKILLPGANADRFVRESKITARLPHPGIPPVHALGTLADGSPFLAMKLVAGRTLADEMKHVDRPRLLQAFAQVCQAVGFAHSHGIIHRDLKPANVMVGTFGEVQVMDWGVAKDLTSQEVPVERHAPESSPAAVAEADPGATIDHGVVGESTDDRTQAGAVMGTPAYMAPEQARGEPTDARADVFALGGILCAILTGRPPFGGGSAMEVIGRAGAADLTEAHARLENSGADAELIGLCRLCLSPKPADRPADGQAVAAEMTAYLDGVQERLRKAELAQAEAMARAAEQARRRRLRVALAATVLLAVLGGVVGTSIYLVQAQRARGEQASRQGRNAEAVAALLAQAEEALRRGDAARAGVALDAAKKRSEEGGAEMEAERLGRLIADLGLLRDLDAIDEARWTWSENKALDPVAAATKSREALARVGIDPEASADEAVARVSSSVLRERIVAVLDGILLRQQKQHGVYALLRQVDADPYRDEVRDAALARDWAKLAELAGREQALEQPPGFTAVLGESQAIDVQRRRDLLAAALGRQPGNLGLLMTMGISYPNDRKEFADERLRWFQAAAAAAPANAAPHNNLGNTLLHKSKLDEAIACYRKALEIDPTLAKAHNNLGNALADKGEVEKAIACYHKALEIDPKFASAHNNLGTALSGKGRVDEAIACCHKAIALDPTLAKAHSHLGKLLVRQGKLDEAIACCRKAIDLDPEFAGAHHALGDVMFGKGKLDEAIASYRKALDLDPKLLPAHLNLGIVMSSKGKLDEAVACYRKVLEIDPKHDKAHLNLGEALLRQGKLDEAMACFRKASELDPNSVDPHYNLACCSALAAAGRGEGAGKIDDKERARLRQQALDELKVLLALDTRQLSSGRPADRAVVRNDLKELQGDADLASVREAAALAKLPPEERAAWQKLWADVAALLKKAETPPTADGKK